MLLFSLVLHLATLNPAPPRSTLGPTWGPPRASTRDVAVKLAFQQTGMRAVEIVDVGWVPPSWSITGRDANGRLLTVWVWNDRILGWVYNDEGISLDEALATVRAAGLTPNDRGHLLERPVQPFWFISLQPTAIEVPYVWVDWKTGEIIHRSEQGGH